MAYLNVGLVFGCFIPLHIGHLSIINQALRENNFVILGVCGYADDRGKDLIPFADRIELIKKHYANDRRVFISVVDDKKIGLTGKFDEDAWKTWCTEYFNNVPFDPDEATDTFTWYTGDIAYVEKLSKLFPKHNFFLKARGDLSGTLIRNDLKNNLNLVDPLFVRYLKEHNKLD